MKKSKVLVLFFLLLLLFATIVAFGSPTAEKFKASQWAKAHFARGVLPPFSFVYGGEKSDSFIKKWAYNAEVTKSSEANVEEMVYTYSDNKSGLVIKCFVTCYTDFNAVEWVTRFINTSSRNTPILEKSAVIKSSFSYEQTGTFILHHLKGSDAQKNDFQPYDDALQIGRSVYMTPSRYRSSDNTGFPFFNIESPAQQGIMVSIGWSGKWYAEVLQESDRSVSLSAGMENMHLTLYPKEEIRTPRISLLFWHGADRMAGHNQLRRFILAHHSRKINGQPAIYPLSGSFDYGDPAPCGEYECLSEEFAIALVKRYQQFGMLPELFWLDAGWYSGCGLQYEHGRWHENVGNWSVEKSRFPNGLKPVADAVHAAGAKFMVWFEPERVRKGTQIYTEHPDWLLLQDNKDDALFDLGNAQARLWLTDHISDFIQKEGIDYYRQDFNMDPGPFWKMADKPDRIGISEAKHIEGLYAFWDSLLVRFPNMIIDNCASGGRRLDLETTSRSAPFWRTDYQYGEPNGYQNHTFGLHLYLPIHGSCVYKTDSYTFRSGLGATMVMNWEVTGKGCEPIAEIQKRIAEYKKLRPFYYADYYPLTPGIKDYTRDNYYLAYQLNRPENMDGIIVAFRREQNNDESIHIKLRGLVNDTRYELYFEDYGIHINQTGKELAEDWISKFQRDPVLC
jgi:alpha-galactosidase